MDQTTLLTVLKSEIERSTGCTDPGSVALAVARATRELGTLPEQISVTVSPNVFKNGISVGVPGTGKRGLGIAAALGAVINRPAAGLAIFDHVTPAALAQANTLIAAERVQIRSANTPDPLYIHAQVSAGDTHAHAIIVGDYSNIVQVARNDTIVFSAPNIPAIVTEEILMQHSLDTLFALIETIPPGELEFLIHAAEINYQAAQVGLGDPAMKLGRALEQRVAALPTSLAAMHTAQAWTAAATEARMRGLVVPIMAITGSGNHGIANFLGVRAVADTLGSPRDKLARALARSSVVTVLIKGYLSRMTAVCGCSVAASTGIAAGTVYLLGGDYAQSVMAMQSVIGTLAGMICDGAKESCAYKVSSSVAQAVQFAFAAMQGAAIPADTGIVGHTLKATLENLGQLNNPGMMATDRLVLRLIEKNIHPPSGVF